MTEAEWQSNAIAIDGMVDHCATLGSERKLRLFLHTCCCRIEPALVDAQSKVILDRMEHYLEGSPNQEELLALQARAREASAAVTGPLDVDDLLDPSPESLAADAILALTNPSLATKWDGGNFEPLTWAAIDARGALFRSIRRTGSLDEARAAEATEIAVQVKLLRDIFGNPFRPIIFPPRWRTDTAMALARQMYDSREFSAMPILADALQDAGCDNDDILSHCRGEGPHVRGCWVVDLVLDKQ